MSNVVIERWIDIESDEFKNKDKFTYRFTLRSIEVGAVVPDKAGYLWCNGKPVWAELDGKIVGLRYAAKASN
jgi:hypothetical protein